MKLISIDKLIYRKRLNLIIVLFVLGFGCLGVAFGQILIHFFGEVVNVSLANNTAEAPNNFNLNLLGVILALVLSSYILHRLKHTTFFYEVYYVWKLKQIHNRIYRKLNKIKALANSGDADAYLVLSFYYESLKHVYELDDNTLVISKVNKDINELKEALLNANLQINTDDFSERLLRRVEQKLPELKPI